MLKIQNKSTKRIRVAQIIFFLIEIFLTSFPFVWGGVISEKSVSAYTVLDIISFIGANTGNADKDSMLNTLGLCYTLFLIIPVIAVGFQIFDREYNLKNIAGLLCSAIGITLIIYFVGPQYICIGSVVALIVYLITFFMSFMGMIARCLKIEN